MLLKIKGGSVVRTALRKILRKYVREWICSQNIYAKKLIFTKTCGKEIVRTICQETDFYEKYEKKIDRYVSKPFYEKYAEKSIGTRVNRFLQKYAKKSIGMQINHF